MPVDIQKMFNEQLPAGMAKNPDAAKAIGTKYQLNVSGDGGGQWYIDCSASGPSVQAGSPGGAECTIGIDSADFPALVADPQAAGMKLFFAGKLKIDGNPMLALKLSKLFELI